jgi:hypothetical protein
MTNKYVESFLDPPNISADKAIKGTSVLAAIIRQPIVKTLLLPNKVLQPGGHIDQATLITAHMPESILLKKKFFRICAA